MYVRISMANQEMQDDDGDVFTTTVGVRIIRWRKSEGRNCLDSRDCSSLTARPQWAKDEIYERQLVLMTAISLLQHLVL